MTRTDAELLRETRRDPAAFAAFYDRYEGAVVGYFKRYVNDPEVVADLTAEAFAAMLGAARRYQPRQSTAAGWVFTIARNTIRRSIRKKRVEARCRLRLGIREAVVFRDQELERVDELLSTETSLLSLLDELPHQQADAVRARVLDGRAYTDIAAELQTSELVVRKRVSRGLGALRQSFHTEAER